MFLGGGSSELCGVSVGEQDSFLLMRKTIAQYRISLKKRSKYFCFCGELWIINKLGCGEAGGVITFYTSV